MKIFVAAPLFAVVWASAFIPPSPVPYGYLRKWRQTSRVRDVSGTTPAGALGLGPESSCAPLPAENSIAKEWDAIYFSPAKVNLFLRVIGKRPDGYHDLASLFQTVSFGDYLYFRKLPTSASKDRFECNMASVPTDGSNLVLKALELFRQRTSTGDFYEIFLSKMIPPEAGLGGGSANAATALFAVNELAGRPALTEDLQEWSGELGSDIPFFFSSGTCYCTGRGEILHPQQSLVPARVWLVKPSGGLSTPTVFRNLDYDHLSQKDPLGLLKKFVEHGMDEADFVNDLELPAFKAMPSLLRIKSELQALGFRHVLMSGSGSTIFCIGDSSCHGSWVEAFKKKWDALVVESSFINRCTDRDTWYMPLDVPRI